MKIINYFIKKRFLILILIILYASIFTIIINSNELIAETKRRAYEYLLRKEETIAAFDALGLLEQIRERVKLFFT